MIKKKLAYINYDCFLDTDLTVLKELSKYYQIIWVPILKEGSNFYSDYFLKNYAYENNINIYIYKYNFRFRSPKNLKLFYDISKVIKQHNCEILITACNNIYWTIISSIFLRKILIITGIHDVVPHSGFNSSMWINLSLKLSVFSKENFIFYSKNQMDIFNKKYKKNTFYVGMSYKDFGNSNVNLKPISNGVKLLFFGRIDAYKGLDTLISDLEILYKENIQNIQLTIAGRGPFWDKCAPLIKTNQLFNLQIRFIDNKEIPNLMCQHHFLVLPYRDATQSGPLMIAVRYNMPIIAPNWGCFSEIYTSESALLYESDNLIGALKKCSIMTDDEYLKMKNNCIINKENYSEEKIVSNYVSFSEKLLK